MVNNFLARGDANPSLVLTKSKTILCLFLQNANQDSKFLLMTTTNQKTSLTGNKKHLVGPKLISTEKVIQMHSIDSFTPGQKGPLFTSSEVTAAVESRLVLTTPLPKSISPLEHQRALVGQSGWVTHLTAKAKELLKY